MWGYLKKTVHSKQIIKPFYLLSNKIVGKEVEFLYAFLSFAQTSRPVPAPRSLTQAKKVLEDEQDSEDDEDEYEDEDESDPDEQQSKTQSKDYCESTSFQQCCIFPKKVPLGGF